MATKEELARFEAGNALKPSPPPPKIPQKIRDKFSDLRDAWDEYDRAWEKWVKGNQNL